MSTIEERQEYLKNPFFSGHIFGDYTPFYITIAICSVVALFLIILNVVFYCCSSHRNYWKDPYTGNRWICSLWTGTPHKQTPLDLAELENVKSFHPQSLNIENDPYQGQGKKFNFGRSQQKQGGEEFVELQKRESDI